MTAEYKYIIRPRLLPFPHHDIGKTKEGDDNMIELEYNKKMQQLYWDTLHLARDEYKYNILSHDEKDRSIVITTRTKLTFLIYEFPNVDIECQEEEEVK